MAVTVTARQDTLPSMPAPPRWWASPAAWVIAYLLIGACLLPVFRYALNPDSTAIISIARHYLHGDAGAAVNGYWNPLLCWLLVPLLALGLPAATAIKLILLGSGLLAWWGMRRLMGALGIDEGIRRGIEPALLPILLYLVYSTNTADLLGAALLLPYFALIFSPRYGTGRWDGVACGALGALAYLAKTYNLPFFLAHFTLTTAVYALHGEMRVRRPALLRHYLLGVLALIVVCGWWIGLISHKYGFFTVGTSGAYNMALVGPASSGHPMRSRGLMPPPTPDGVSVWDDPSYFRLPAWSPWATPAERRHTLALLMRNGIGMAKALCFFSLFAPLILLFALATLRRPRSTVVHPLGSLVLYAAGYLLVTVGKRYLYPTLFLLLCLAGTALMAIPERKRGQTSVIAVVLGSFILMPIWNIIVPVVKYARGTLHDRQFYDTAVIMTQQLHVTGRLASDEKWAESLAIAFSADCPYYGMARPGESDAEFIEELARYEIDYFLAWGDSSPHMSVLARYPEVSHGTLPHLRLYRIHGQPTGDTRTARQNSRAVSKRYSVR